MPLVHKARITQQRTELLRLADRLEPRIKKRVIDALNKIRSKQKITELAKAIQDGDMAAIMRLSGILEIPSAVDDIYEEVQNAYISGGKVAASTARTSDGAVIAARFNGVNNRGAEFILRNKARLVTDVVRGSRDAIAEALARGVLERKTPIVAARTIRDLIGLDKRRAASLLRYRDALENSDFGIASARDIGASAARTINAASGGRVNLTQSRINDLVEGYRDRLIASRAGTIAATETFSALNQASQEAFTQVMEDRDIPADNIRRFWVSTNDSHTRESHREIPVINDEGVGMDEPFQLPDGGTIMYPHDPSAPPEETVNCRCTVVYRMVNIPEAALPPIKSGRSIL